MLALPVSRSLKAYVALALAATMSVLVSACDSNKNATSVPGLVLSGAEVRQWESEATALGDRYHNAWPDVGEAFADFAEDATFYDPTDGDFLIEGKALIVSAHQAMAGFFVTMDTQTTGVYLAAEDAAYTVDWINLWPPWVPEPPDHPPVGGIEVFHVNDGLVTNQDLWFTEETLKMTGLGCFAAGGCSTELREIADRYVKAWSSGDRDLVAALYSKDAVFSDSMFGLKTEGASSIGDLADRRFLTNGDITLEVLRLYAQTNHYLPPTEASPDLGRIIGVGIHYRWTVTIDGKVTTAESLTTFEFGTRHGKAFDIDPSTLITREEVFHDPASLLAADLAP